MYSAYPVPVPIHYSLIKNNGEISIGKLHNFTQGIPIGLIDSSWGGTIVEAWSPPEALEQCGVTDNGIGEENNHNEYLWNGMIYPLLKMTIR